MTSEGKPQDIFIRPGFIKIAVLYDVFQSSGCGQSYIALLLRTTPVFLHVIVLSQHWPHRSHKPPRIFTQIALSMRYGVCLHFVHIQCLTTLVKKCVCVKILLHANIHARQAALVRNYFFRRNNFRFHQINTYILFRRVNYRYLATLRFLQCFYTMF